MVGEGEPGELFPDSDTQKNQWCTDCCRSHQHRALSRRVGQPAPYARRQYAHCHQHRHELADGDGLESRLVMVLV